MARADCSPSAASRSAPYAQLDNGAKRRNYAEDPDHTHLEQMLSAVKTALGPSWGPHWKAVNELMSAMLNDDKTERLRIMHGFAAMLPKSKYDEDIAPLTPESEEDDFNALAKSSKTLHTDATSAPHLEDLLESSATDARLAETVGDARNGFQEAEKDDLEEGELPSSPPATKHTLPPFRGTRLSNMYQKPVLKSSVRHNEGDYTNPDVNDSAVRQTSVKAVVQCLLGPLEQSGGTASPIRVSSLLRELPPQVHDEVYAVTKVLHNESALAMGERFHADISTDRERNRGLLEHSDFVLVPTVWNKPPRDSQVASLEFSVTPYGGQIVKLHPLFVVSIDKTCVYGHLCGTRGGSFETSVPVSEQHRFMKLVSRGATDAYRFDVLEVTGRESRSPSYIDKALVCVPLDSPMAPDRGYMEAHSKVVFANMIERFSRKHIGRFLIHARIDGRYYENVTADLRDWEEYWRDHGSVHSAQQRPKKRKRGSSDSAHISVNASFGNDFAHQQRATYSEDEVREGEGNDWNNRPQPGKTGITGPFDGMNVRPAPE